MGEPGARSVAPATLDLLRTFWRESSAETLAAAFPERILRDLRGHLSEWLVFVLERRFRSAAGVERELALLR